MTETYNKRYKCNRFKDVLYTLSYICFYILPIAMCIVIPNLLFVSIKNGFISVIINMTVILSSIFFSILTFSYLTSKVFKNFKYNKNNLWDIENYSIQTNSKYYIIFDFNSYKKSHSRNVNIEVYMTIFGVSTSDLYKNISVNIKIPSNLIEDNSIYNDENKLKNLCHSIVDDKELKGYFEYKMVLDKKVSRNLKLQMLNI